MFSNPSISIMPSFVNAPTFGGPTASCCCELNHLTVLDTLVSHAFEVLVVVIFACDIACALALYFVK